MANKATRVTVGTTATRLDVAVEADWTSDSNFASLRGDGQSIAVRPRGASIFVGGPDVTAAAGFEVIAEEVFAPDLLPGDALYGIVASGSVTCHVFQSGV